MRRHFTVRRTLTAVISTSILLLGLTGCAAAVTESAPESTAGSTPAADSATDLYDYLSAMYPVRDDDADRADHDEIETLLVTCMTEQGFSYFPDEYIDYTEDETDSATEPVEDSNTETWVAEHGYGRTDLPDADDDTDDETNTSPADPNDDYVSSLDTDAYNAYYAALYGADDLEEESAGKNSGCDGAASYAVHGAVIDLHDLHKPLLDSVDALRAAAALAPEWVALDAEWAACMSTAGHPEFATQPTAVASIDAEIEALYTNGLGMTEDARLEIHAREVPLALADFRCAAEVRYDARSADLVTEAEAQFVIVHESELDALVADFTALS